MTLDKLANMVAGGFADMDKRFENVPTKAGVNFRFDELDRKIEKVAERTSELYAMLMRLEEEDILNLQRRVRVLERAVKILSKQAA